MIMIKVKVKVSTYWGSGGIAPHSLDLGTRWRWVVSFTPREKSFWYPLDRRLGEPQNQSGGGVEEKSAQPLPGLEPPDHPARSPALYNRGMMMIK
jgi:hypothetical protein